jgi:hypothetical protein
MYKLMTFNCTGKRLNDCDCGINQWTCGYTANVSLSPCGATLQPCFSYSPQQPDCRHGSPTDNSVVCTRKISPSYSQDNTVNTVVMVGSDAPGVAVWSGATKTNPCPTSAAAQNGPAGLALMELEFTTCCNCPTPGSPTSGTCWPWSFNASANINEDTSVVWGGECAGSKPQCTKMKA